MPLSSSSSQHWIFEEKGLGRFLLKRYRPAAGAKGVGRGIIVAVALLIVALLIVEEQLCQLHS